MGGMIGKGYMLRVVMVVICLLVSGIGNAVVGIGLTFLLYAGYVVFMYAEGTQAGEAQCTMTDTVRKIREQGKTPTDAQLKRCFNPRNGYIAFAVLVLLPSLIFAVINLITADPGSTSQGWFGVVTRVWFLPEVFLTRLCNELVKTDIGGLTQAASAALKGFQGGSLNAENLISSAAQLNGTYIYVTSNTALRILNILYIPMSFLPPAAMLYGYMKGPKLRAKTLNDMMKGSNKKLRRMRKQRTHVPRSQKPEI